MTQDRIEDLRTDYEEVVSPWVDELTQAGCYGNGITLDYQRTAELAAMVKALAIIADVRGGLVNELAHMPVGTTVSRRYPNITLLVKAVIKLLQMWAWVISALIFISWVVS